MKRTRSSNMLTPKKTQPLTTSFTLNPNSTLRKLQQKIKSDGVEGRWRVIHDTNAERRTFWSSDQADEQPVHLASFEDDTISLRTNTKMYNIMKLSIADMVTKVKTQSPNQKGKGTKQGSTKKKKTTPAKGNNEHNDDNEEEYDDASGLVLDNEEWAFKSSHFKRAIKEAFGIDTRVAGAEAHAVTIWKKGTGRKMKKVTLNYYPTTGRFMLTGTTENRARFENFFQNLVEKGPVYGNEHHSPKPQSTQMPPKKLKLDAEEGEEEEVSEAEDADTLAAKKKAATIKKEGEAAGQHPGQALEANKEEEASALTRIQSNNNDRALELIEDHVQDKKKEKARVDGTHVHTITITDHLARTLADGIANKMLGDADTKDMRKKHMRALVHMVMEDAMGSDSENPPNYTPPIAQEYLQNLAKTTSSTIITYLKKGVKKWAKVSSELANALPENERRSEGKNGLLTFYKKTITNQHQTISGLETQLEALSARLKVIEQGKKDTGPTIPKGSHYQYHEVVRKLITMKHLDPNNKDIIPFVSKIHHAGKQAESVARMRDAEEATENLRVALDEVKGSVLSMQLAQKQKGPRSGIDDAMGTLSRNDITKVVNQLRGHIKNTVLEILLAQDDTVKNEEEEDTAAADQKRPYQASQGTTVAAPKKRAKKAAVPMAMPVKKEERMPPAMGTEDIPTMETPPPKVERWEATDAEYMIVQGEFESVNVDGSGPDLEELTAGTYHAIRCGLFSPGYLATELKRLADAEEEEVHTVVGRVKVWSHKIAAHHGHSNPKGNKGGNKRGHRGRGRG